jgi:hypothetical protein
MLMKLHEFNRDVSAQYDSFNYAKVWCDRSAMSALVCCG